MISEERIAIAEQLILDEKLSQRQIAKQTGLSRATIGAIASGKRRIFKRKPLLVIEHDKNSPHVRCPGCGLRVRLPCVRCLLQKYGKKQKITNEKINKTDFSINLTDGEAKRYQEIRRWRERQKNPHFTEIPDDWPWRK